MRRRRSRRGSWRADAAASSSCRARRRSRRAPTWTLALAHRFKGTGATANVLVVGAIATPEMRAEDPDKDYSTFTPAEEIAEAIAFLCSDAAASMNGQRLVLRGAA